jgi:hypothetical protein
MKGPCNITLACCMTTSAYAVCMVEDASATAEPSHTGCRVMQRLAKKKPVEK